MNSVGSCCTWTVVVADEDQLQTHTKKSPSPKLFLLFLGDSGLLHLHHQTHLRIFYLTIDSPLCSRYDSAAALHILTD